jgi:hypothetical protein
MEPKLRYPVQSNSQFATTVSQFHPTHLPAYLFQMSFQIICPIYQYFFQVVSFLQPSPPKPCTHLSSPHMCQLCEQNKSLFFSLWNYAPSISNRNKTTSHCAEQLTHQERNAERCTIYNEAERKVSGSDRANPARLPTAISN